MPDALADRALTLVVRWSIGCGLCASGSSSDAGQQGRKTKMKPCHWVRMLIGFWKCVRSKQIVIPNSLPVSDWSIDYVLASFLEWARDFNWASHEMSFTHGDASLRRRAPPAPGRKASAMCILNETGYNETQKIGAWHIHNIRTAIATTLKYGLFSLENFAACAGLVDETVM